MPLPVLAILAVVAGYAGGFLAWRQARRKDVEEFRSSAEALLSELTQAAAEATDAVIKERLRLEKLLAEVRKEVLSPTSERGGAISGRYLVPDECPPSPITEAEKKVLTMAGAGEDVAAIAQSLGLGRGEVELILNLRSEIERRQT
ncbi:MAG: hypothetical protein PWP12_21 [Bacillota bacterium]|jgi:type II secretory pathway pseudopilin PulG|nr:hypothetical protein [Bacillota bacterium]MDK2881712.1 hypothetical protein [Bacillota bacterium]MDK2959837.1 hypothetical protein [Bacillota bacterium]